MHGLLPARGNCMGLDWNWFKAQLCCLRFGALVAHGTRRYSIAFKEQLGFILDDLRNVKY